MKTRRLVAAVGVRRRPAARWRRRRMGQHRRADDSADRDGHHGRAPRSTIATTPRPTPSRSPAQATRKYQSLDGCQGPRLRVAHRQGRHRVHRHAGHGRDGHALRQWRRTSATPSVHLRQPEAVVYETVHGHTRLVALEYVVLKADWESVHGVGRTAPEAVRPTVRLHR